MSVYSNKCIWVGMIITVCIAVTHWYRMIISNFYPFDKGLNSFKLLEGEGGYKTGEGGGHVKFYPYEKGSREMF